LSERRQIRILVIISALIALAGSQIAPLLGAAEGEAVVTQYTAVFHANGRLEETFTYKINEDGKRFLFRYWEAPLSNKDLGFAQIQLLDIDVPEGTFWYLVDNQGDLYTSDNIDSSSSNTIRAYAYWNEAGAFYPFGYSPSEYTVKFWYKIYPPIEYDNEYTHLNLKLASEHIKYQNVRVEIENLGFIEKIYPHPPTLKKSTDKNWIVFTGTSAENELLEFELLMTPEALNHIDGYPREEFNIKAQTVEANNKYSFEYLVAQGFLWFNKIATFIVPVTLYGLWLRYGKEKDYSVPQFLSTIPNKTRKPWIVNLVFKKDATDFDEDGLHATLLDLHERSKINVEVEENEAVIRLIDDKGLDRYENQVMNFLRRLSRNNMVRTEYMKEMVEMAQIDSIVEQRVIGLKERYMRLVAGTDNEVAGEYTTNGRKRIALFLTLSILLTFGPLLSLIFYDNATMIFLGAAGYGVITLVQFITAIVFPTTLFGFWKKDNYQEKLQWNAFKRHLSDFSRLEQYGPEDINMWGPWLVYGTSLGVGEKVAEAMQNLRIEYPAMRLVQTYPFWFRPIYTARTPSMRSSSGGGGGGGGFGGGGGGVR
jgi:uncharacterized membrane protein